MSSPKIIEYKIIGDYSPNNIQTKINNFLQDGWSLYGYFTVAKDYYYIQTMVKYESTTTSNPTVISDPNNSNPTNLTPTLILSGNELKPNINLVSFNDAEIKQMQDACNELIKVLDGRSIDYKYAGKKSTCVCNMPNRLKNHLRSIGYDFSPEETHRNENYCYMFLK
jgi:hypothetical protein